LQKVCSNGFRALVVALDLATRAFEFCLRVVGMTLATVGVAVVCLVTAWKVPAHAPLTPLEETIRVLRHDGLPLLSVFLVLASALVILTLPLRSARPSPLRCDHRGAARHEAAHALVACVLGMPLVEAFVHAEPRGGRGGGITLAPFRTRCTPEGVRELVVRKIAIGVAGQAVDWDGPVHGGMFCGGGERDFVQCQEMFWIWNSVAPDWPCSGNTLAETLIRTHAALRTPAWRQAVAAGADALLRDLGKPVPPDVFATIAREHNLALPEVVALAGGEKHRTDGGE
jgi:hypothetical protein